MDFRNILKKRTRGLILKALDMMRFKDLSLSAIGAALAEWHCPASDNEIKTEIRYLEQKGYVVLAEDGDAAVLTARGVDLLEQSIPEDPGVMVDA